MTEKRKDSVRKCENCRDEYDPDFVKKVVGDKYWTNEFCSYGCSRTFHKEMRGEGFET